MLNKLQRLALVGVTGAMRTAPTAALEALLNISPLHIHIEAVARSTALRFNMSNNLLKSNFGHAKIWALMTKIPLNLRCLVT